MPVESGISYCILLTYKASFDMASNIVPLASFQISLLIASFFNHILYSTLTFSFSFTQSGLVLPDLSTCRRASVSAHCFLSFLTDSRKASVVGAERSVASDALLDLSVALRRSIASRRDWIEVSSSASSSGVAASLAS